MRRRSQLALVAAAALVGLTPSPASPATPRIAVPYVAQTEALCGGAAVSMVAHYWGHRDIHAADFAPPIHDRAQGIRIDDLIHAVERRGWSAWAFPGDPALVMQHLRHHRPLIVLIEDRPGRMHYVVVVAWDDGGVVVHDPTRGPNQIIDPERFERVWRVSGYLTLLLLPPAVSRDGAPTGTVEAAARCDDLVMRAVRSARAGDGDPAEKLLHRAIAACPHSAVPVRELAGLRLRQSRWLDASRLAEQAVGLDENDSYSWRVLAVGRFLAGDASRALDAWNTIDEPRVDLIDVSGLTRTRASIVADVIELSPRELLVEERLRHARRRLEGLPSVTGARIAYRPRMSGQADVEVHVRERPLVVHGAADALWTVGRAVVEQHGRLALSSPTGGGEVWSGDWRWQRNRPRLGMSLVVPQPSAVGRLWRVDAEWERHSFGSRRPSRATDISTETHHRVALQVGDWVTPDVRWSAGAGLDQWSGRGHHLSLDLGVEARAADDRAAVQAEASVWVPMSHESAFMTSGVTASWRGPAPIRGTSVRTRVGLHGVTSVAPLSLWPRPDTGQAGATLLRAHPALRHGIVRSDQLGQALVGGSVEIERSLGRIGPIGSGLVMFTDVARAWNTAALPFGAGPRFQIDVGVGLRFDVLGEDHRLGLDLGHGLRDGGTVVSIGWSPAFP